MFIRLTNKHSNGIKRSKHHPLLGYFRFTNKKRQFNSNHETPVYQIETPITIKLKKQRRQPASRFGGAKMLLADVNLLEDTQNRKKMIMSKINVTKRHHAIINKLLVRRANFKEITAYLANNAKDTDLTISQRTFGRDIKDINTIYGIDIRYDSRNKNYYIASNNCIDDIQQLLKASQINSILHLDQEYESIVHFQARAQTESPLFHKLLKYISKQQEVRLFTNHQIKEGLPLSLLEYNYQWFVMLIDLDTKTLFSLDIDKIDKLEYMISHGSIRCNKYYKWWTSFFAKVKECPLHDLPVEIAFSPKPTTLPTIDPKQRIISEDNTSITISILTETYLGLLASLLSKNHPFEIVSPSPLKRFWKEKILNRDINIKNY